LLKNTIGSVKQPRTGDGVRRKCRDRLMTPAKENKFLAQGIGLAAIQGAAREGMGRDAIARSVLFIPVLVLKSPQPSASHNPATPTHR